MNTKRLRAIRIVLASMLLLSSMALLSPVAQADTSVTVNATQRYQTIQGLGVNANVHSWNNGQLVPALDQLTDQLGATAFRVVIDNADWEATNDNTDPNVFNWDYYNTVYGSTKFTDLWNTIAYLNSKHATVSISVMGPLPTWMGGSSLLPNQEPEWVEMMASLIYYGRVVKGLNVTLFEPFNEPDLTNGIEGVQAGAAQVVRVMHELGDRLDTLGLSDVKFILPDTASIGSGLDAYFTAMQGDSDLMGKVAALGLHDYGGDTGGADSLIKGSSYPALPFWMTEFSAPCSGCDYGSPNPADWPFAKTMAQYMMNNLSQNAAGAEVWEGYDSFYEHHNSWSYWGLLGFDQTAGTYSPRKSFYAMTQFMRFIPRGSVRIGASSGNGNLSLLAFHDPSSGRVTLVGLNTSSAAETISGTLTGIDGLNSMAYYRTNATANMEGVGDVPITAGQFSTTVPADTLFTLTGVAGPDTTPPTVALTSPTAGATVAGPMQLTATASDDRGVTRVEFSVDNTVVGSATQAPYQVAWDARTVDPGTHTITARAVDAAGNSASSSAEVTVIRDITPPSTPAGLEASSPTAGEVRLSWQPSTDNIAVAGYVVLRDGTSVGSATTTSYVDTTVISGHTYSYTVEARDTSDNVSPPSTPVTVTVGSQVVVTVDTTATTHQTSAASTITSPAFSTTKAGDLLVVFVGSDGSTTSAQSFNSVTGAGLTWRLRQRANAQAGTAEIWTAVAPTTLSNVQVTATRSSGAYFGSLTVVAFSGADTVTDGATAGKSAASGAPSVQLTTTRANSWVWAIGHDWDRAIARTVPADQELVDQYLASVQDTFWVQRLKAPTPNAGTLVTVNDTAPTTDRWNFSAIEIRPASASPPDTTPPAVAITAPTAGATVSGTTTVTASASDNIGVTKVEFYVDGGMPVATTTTAPYTFSWNTTTFANGSHRLTAKAYDEAGNSATSSTVTVTVDNGDHTPPTITITTPANGATVSGTTTVTASATDNVDVTKVEFYVDDGSTPVATTTTVPYTFGWNTTTISDGQHQLIAKAYDAAGNVGTSATVSVQVDNADHIPPTPPTGLSATALSATEVGLSWQASSDNVGVTGYTVFRDGTQVGTSASTSYHDTTVQPSTTYTYTVAARDAAGNVSAPSDPATITTPAPPDMTAPTVAITEPAAGASVSDTTTVTATATDNIGVTKVELYVDGTLVGSDASAPYSFAWNTTTTPNGTHELSTKAYDAAGNVGTSSPVPVTVANATTLSVDASVTTDQTRASTTTTSPAFSTTKAGDLLVVFVGSDGPDRSSSQSFRSVTGGGLTWRLRQRANAQAGTAEIWTAVAPATLSNVRVTATRARGSYLGSLTVVAFSGADTTTDGTTAGASAASGAPTVRLTTTRANAWVWAVGNDWDRAIARTVPTGQTLVHQYLPSVGDTFWVQRLDEPTPAAGTTVTIHDTAPTTDRWNFSAIEIVPRSATPPSSKGG